MNFIENLNELMNLHGISRNKLAKEIGISEGTIRSWDNGKLPTIDKLIKITQYFAISSDEILGLTEDNFDSKLIKAYHIADPVKQEMIRDILHISNRSPELSTSKIG